MMMNIYQYDYKYENILHLYNIVPISRVVTSIWSFLHGFVFEGTDLPGGGGLLPARTRIFIVIQTQVQ